MILTPAAEEHEHIWPIPKTAVQTPLGIFIGVITHIFVGIVFGIVTSYYLYYSGTDYAVIKGISLSLIGLFITLGIVFPLRELVPEIHDSPNDVLSAFIDHIVFGVVAGSVIKYLQQKQSKLKPG